MSESEYEPVTPAGQPTTWYTTPVPLSTVQRLDMLGYLWVTMTG